MGKADNITIEAMRKEDIDQVLSIESSSFSVPWSRNLFLSEFRSPSVSTLLIANAGGTARHVVGYIIFWLVADEMHILNLAVAPTYRRRGIARELVFEALNRGYEKGARRSFLEVRSSNSAARKLYSSLGFTGISLRRDYYDYPVEDAIIMTLEPPAFKALIKHGKT